MHEALSKEVMNDRVKLLIGNARERLDEIQPNSVQCVVTSPPYFHLRDYGAHGQLGLEREPFEYVQHLVEIFRKVRRVLRPDGIVWLIIGDTFAGGGNGGGGSYAIDRMHLANKNHQAHWKYGGRRRPNGFKDKDLIGIPWRVAFALQEDGWWLRQDNIWHKPNPMPENARDRCTKAHEYIFHLSKSERYFFNHEAIREKGVYPAGTKGAKASAHRFYEYRVNSRPPEYKIYDGFRNKRSVWTVSTKPCKEKHYATFPPELIEPCVLAGSRPGDIVLDCFAGTGTTGAVALRHGRRAVLIELGRQFAPAIRRRLAGL